MASGSGSSAQSQQQAHNLQVGRLNSGGRASSRAMRSLSQPQGVGENIVLEEHVQPQATLLYFGSVEIQNHQVEILFSLQGQEQPSSQELHFSQP
uniref:Uncharacterized protein n=1 Tax=Nelumbo nucifera TaxID=4432 RepID=A0A822ZEV5_NELNU|nr:TPA_asm: hypothetical protein HUJ06_001290 [Nelumbo nucifera]